MLKPSALSLIAALLTTTAYAGDPLTDAIQSAYAPYRVALFKTNSKSQTESRDAVLQARTKWAELTVRYAAQPPMPYANDTRFKEDCVKVDAVYAKAAGEIERGELAPAHETLEEVRDILADLRRRNGIVVFSDHMNAYHSEMEHLFDNGKKLLAEDKGALRLMARVGSLTYLAQRMKREAPANLQANAEFVSLNQAVVDSVAELEKAVLSGAEPAIHAAIGGLKKPYGRMFLKFG